MGYIDHKFFEICSRGFEFLVMLINKTKQNYSYLTLQLIRTKYNQNSTPSQIPHIAELGQLTIQKGLKSWTRETKLTILDYILGFLGIEIIDWLHWSARIIHHKLLNHPIAWSRTKMITFGNGNVLTFNDECGRVTILINKGNWRNISEWRLSFALPLNWIAHQQMHPQLGHIHMAMKR
jgi:hypothetical protein